MATLEHRSVKSLHSLRLDLLVRV